MPATFRYLLYSVVVCLAGGGVGNGVVSMTNTTTLGGWDITNTQIRVRLIPDVAMGSILDAYFACNITAVRTHVLLSVDSVAQVLQVYVNDAPLSLTSGGWTGSGMLNVAAGYSNWNLLSAGSSNALPGGGPGVADAWLASPPSFFDLSVVANRRKFINADLSLVDLGTNGSEPGIAPPIFLTVRPGDSNADHFANNNGSGGGPWTSHTPPITFETGGVCTVPSIVVPPSGGGGSLAMDDVIAIDQTRHEVAGSQIFLDWSDDRGHRFGSPVGQPIGQTGEYLTSVQWQRLSYGRDRIFRLTWSVPVATALQGAFIEVDTNAKS